MVKAIVFVCTFTLMLIPRMGMAHPNVDFSKIVEKSSPAVVSIVTYNTQKTTQKLAPDALIEDLQGTPLMEYLEKRLGKDFQKKLQGKADPGLGSGTIVDPRGIIITNLHVINGANLIYVKLKDQTEYPAQVVGYDRGTDLAVLKIEADNLPFIRFSNSQVKVGQWVMAVGSPFGFEDTVTVGVVSAKGRSLGAEKYVPFLQTDVAINPGNSGGPLLNLKGELVGINAQIVSQSGSYAGLSFAVPAPVIKSVIQQLIAKGFVERPYIGMSFQNLNRSIAESFDLKVTKGALISKVAKNSPAEYSGLQVGDVITEFNGQAIEKATDIPPIVGLLPIGTKVKVEVIRNKKNQDMELVLGKPPVRTIVQKTNLNPSVSLRSGLGVRNINPEQDQMLSEDIQGVVVSSIKSQHWMASGLRRGDVIMQVNQTPVANANQFYQALKALPKQKSFSLLITRDGKVQRFIGVSQPKGRNIQLQPAKM